MGPPFGLYQAPFLMSQPGGVASVSPPIFQTPMLPPPMPPPTLPAATPLLDPFAPKRPGFAGSPFPVSYINSPTELTNARIDAAKERYVIGHAEFEDIYTLYVRAHPNVISVDIEAVKRARDHALSRNNVSESAHAFASVIVSVLEMKKGEARTIATRVGDFLIKLYPLLNLTLGLIQGVSDVKIPTRCFLIYPGCQSFSSSRCDQRVYSSSIGTNRDW
jgi:hypothetical protein